MTTVLMVTSLLFPEAEVIIAGHTRAKTPRAETHRNMAGTYMA